MRAEERSSHYKYKQKPSDSFTVPDMYHLMCEEDSLINPVKNTPQCTEKAENILLERIERKKGSSCLCCFRLLLMLENSANNNNNNQIHQILFYI